MLLKEPLVNAIIIYFISKTVILGFVLAYHSFFRKKIKGPRRKPIDLTRATAPKLVLTLKDGNQAAPGGRQTKTALQQTIEETFSSN